MLASGSNDCTIRIWQIYAFGGECLATFTGHTKPIRALMLFGENKLASAVLGENVRVWNCNIRQKSKIFINIPQTLRNKKNAQFFKPIGIDKLAIVYSKKIRVWNVTSRKYLPNLSFDQQEELSKTTKRSGKTISFLQSHGDSTLIGVVDSTTIIAWNVNTGEHMYILNEHCKPITSLLVVSDRNEFITGALDDTIRVWDVSNGDC